jgi:hypothetical protein
MVRHHQNAVLQHPVSRRLFSLTYRLTCKLVLKIAFLCHFKYTFSHHWWTTCFDQYGHHQVSKIILWWQLLCFRLRSSSQLACGPDCALVYPIVLVLYVYVCVFVCGLVYALLHPIVMVVLPVVLCVCMWSLPSASVSHSVASFFLFYVCVCVCVFVCNIFLALVYPIVMGRSSCFVCMCVCMWSCMCLCIP